MQSKFRAWNVIASVKNMCEMNSVNMSGNVGLFLCSPMYIMEHLLHFHPSVVFISAVLKETFALGPGSRRPL